MLRRLQKLLRWRSLRRDDAVDRSINQASTRRHATVNRVNRRPGVDPAALMTLTYHSHHHHHHHHHYRCRCCRRCCRRRRWTATVPPVACRSRRARGTRRRDSAVSPADDVVAGMSVDRADFHTSTETSRHSYTRPATKHPRQRHVST